MQVYPLSMQKDNACRKKNRIKSRIGSGLCTEYAYLFGKYA
jgi:hypothetical protein